MTQETVTPDQFERMITDSLTETQPETDEDPVAEEETEEASVAEKEALGEPEEEAEAEEAQVEEETEADTEEEKDEKPDAELFEVKVDGEKQQKTREELIKSYERFAASTQRFQQASEMKKAAEAEKAEANRIVQKAKDVFQALNTNPDAILESINPETLHRAFEKYAKRHVADEELKEKDRDLYDATVEQRRREAEIKRQRQELARQKEEIERTNSQSQQEREKASVQKTLGIYNETAPKALKAAGVPDKMLKSITLQNALRSIVQSNWPDGLSLTDLPQHINDCAKELVDDPAIKSMLGATTPSPKKETKKPKATVTSPDPGPSKSKILTPNAFLKSIMG